VVSLFVRSALIGRPPAFAGDGIIAGNSPGLVTVAGAPAARAVHLRDAQTHRLVARTFSGTDGTYRFDDLNPDRRYYLVAFDDSRRFNAVVRDGIQPVVP